MPHPNIFTLLAAFAVFTVLYAGASWAFPSASYVDILLYLAAGFLVGFMSPRDGLIGKTEDHHLKFHAAPPGDEEGPLPRRDGAGRFGACDDVQVGTARPLPTC